MHSAKRSVSRGVRGNDAKEFVRVLDERHKATTSVSGKHSPSRDDKVGLEVCGEPSSPSFAATVLVSV